MEWKNARVKESTKKCKDRECRQRCTVAQEGMRKESCYKSELRTILLVIAPFFLHPLLHSLNFHIDSSRLLYIYMKPRDNWNPYHHEVCLYYSWSWTATNSHATLVSFSSVYKFQNLNCYYWILDNNFKSELFLVTDLTPKTLLNNSRVVLEVTIKW